VEPTDIELMLRAREGDVAAFQNLAQRYREPLRRFFAAVLADPSQADDCVQETFLRLWLARGRYEPTGKFSTYLYQIGKHYWLNQRRKLLPERYASEVLSDDGAEEGLRVQSAAGSSQPERILLERYRHARVRRAIAALPEHYRAVFDLCHVEGLKYAEIGCRLGIPVGTVKSRMSEAVRRLRKALAEDDEGG
jgi:RNA polymerase sigma-70 factor (ECF subfamily)